MTKISNLNINFSNKQLKADFSNKTINIIFYNKSENLITKPSWLTRELDKFLNEKISTKDIDEILLLQTNYGNFLVVRGLPNKISENDSLYFEKLGGKIYSKIKTNFLEKINFFIDDTTLFTNLLKGLCLKSYKFQNYKSPKISNKQKSINLISKNYKEIKKEFEAMIGVIKGVFFARDLVWKPANILFPKIFTEECLRLKSYGVKINILNEKQLEKIGMSSLLAVGRGSSKESYVVTMEWQGGKKNEKPLAIIGKGVCFDSGGLSLKPSKSMEDMKWDMGGAATVTGLMEAVSLTKTKKNILGVIGLVENMPDGNAQRPGDVIKSYSGKTIEVLNTDAEGRLVLADLLSWVENKYKPFFMIDLATLTGAMIVSLGKIRAGLFSNNKILASKIQICGEKTGDKVWEMPMDVDYDKMLNTEIADMKNIGPPGAGSITAACFLKRHVKNNTPWAHLDIAGVTWLNSATDIAPAGGSGWGVKMLFKLVNEFDYKL